MIAKRKRIYIFFCFFIMISCIFLTSCQMETEEDKIAKKSVEYFLDQFQENPLDTGIRKQMQKEDFYRFLEFSPMAKKEYLQCIENAKFKIIGIDNTYSDRYATVQVRMKVKSPREKISAYIYNDLIKDFTPIDFRNLLDTHQLLNFGMSENSVDTLNYKNLVNKNILQNKQIARFKYNLADHIQKNLEKKPIKENWYMEFVYDKETGTISSSYQSKYDFRDQLTFYLNSDELLHQYLIQ